MKPIPSQTPNLYRKTRVYRGILIFDPKHRLWVLVRTANVLRKILKNIKNFPIKVFIFTAENFFYILHGQIFVMSCFVLLSCYAFQIAKILNSSEPVQVDWKTVGSKVDTLTKLMTDQFSRNITTSVEITELFNINNTLPILESLLTNPGM